MKSKVVKSEQSSRRIIFLLLKRRHSAMLLGVLLLACQFTLSAQDYTNELSVKVIGSYPIHVGYNKTTNLIFPFAIKNVDRGSRDILVQKAKGVDNILQVKAGREGFFETNLSIVTVDGKFYSFLVNYDASPSRLNLYVGKDSLLVSPAVLISDIPVDAATLRETAEEIRKKRTFLHLHQTEQKIRLSLSGIYLKNNSMLFSLLLKNSSLIDYTPDYIRFFVRDKKRAKRTAVQEKEIRPLYKDQDVTILGNQETQPVFCFTPFTLSKTQELAIQVGEKNGGRSISLSISHRALLRARLLEE